MAVCAAMARTGTRRDAARRVRPATVGPATPQGGGGGARISRAETADTDCGPPRVHPARGRAGTNLATAAGAGAALPRPTWPTPLPGVVHVCPPVTMVSWCPSPPSCRWEAAPMLDDAGPTLSSARLHTSSARLPTHRRPAPPRRRPRCLTASGPPPPPLSPPRPHPPPTFQWPRRGTADRPQPFRMGRAAGSRPEEGSAVDRVPAAPLRVRNLA